MSYLILPVALVASITCFGKQVDRRCLSEDCVALEIVSGRVLVVRTGALPVRRVIGEHKPQGAALVGPLEASISYSRSHGGWIAVVSAFLPAEFDFDAPELRLRIYDPAGRLTVSEDLYNVLGSIAFLKIGNEDAEFLEASTTGIHSYVVRTAMWLLPNDGKAALVLDVPGAYVKEQKHLSNSLPGVTIARQTYDGFNASTKGERLEVWHWNGGAKSFASNVPR